MGNVYYRCYLKDPGYTWKWILVLNMLYSSIFSLPRMTKSLTMMVACCLVRLNQSAFLGILFNRHPPHLLFSPFHLIQPGLVSPSLEQDQADGSEEEDVGDLDEQDEDVHVDELCWFKIFLVGFILLAQEASDNPHVWEVRFCQWMALLGFRPGRISNCCADAYEERHPLGIEHVL